LNPLRSLSSVRRSNARYGDTDISTDLSLALSILSANCISLFSDYKIGDYNIFPTVIGPKSYDEIPSNYAQAYRSPVYLPSS